MTTPTVDALPPPQPYFHEPSGAVRFWVLAGDAGFVGASIPKEVLHYRFQAKLDGADAMSAYLGRQHEIDEAVRRRVARGSIEPVMLRESDFPRPEPSR